MATRDVYVTRNVMKPQANSFNLRQQIDLYFDNALTPEDQKDLLHKVECDQTCSQLFQKEKTFRDYIKNNVKRSSVSADLIQSIKDRIRV